MRSTNIDRYRQKRGFDVNMAYMAGMVIANTLQHWLEDYITLH